MLRPSKASRRSVTPSPLVERTRLCRDIFSICMSAGEIFRRGDMPSERRTESRPGAFSTEIKLHIEWYTKDGRVLTIPESQICCPLQGDPPHEALPINSKCIQYILGGG